MKCARCGHQWRMLPEEPEELAELVDAELEAFAASSPETQPTAASFEGSTPYGYDPAAGDQSMSWEVRRGNLAAALASMSESIVEDAYVDNGGVDIAGTQQWPERAAFQPAETPAVEPGKDPFGGPEPNGAGTSPYADDLGTGRSDDRWMSEPSAGEADPELSVRQVLQSVIDDPDKMNGEDEGYSQQSGSAISRPVFIDPDLEEPSADPSRDWITKASTEKGYGPAPGTADDKSGVAQATFSDRWKSFAAAGESLQTSRAAEPVQVAENEGESEKFENDIAGIFRQQMQAKRSFGHAPRSKAGSDLNDYDTESDQAQGQADDASMANSPLDADAAALQAALEGSLRERHVEESRSGSGGLALAAAWAVFLSVLTGVTLAFVSFRDDIVVALPGMGALYRSVGLGVQAQQVDFGPVNYRWTVADGKPMIELTGQIINLTDREIAVPRVLINVRDKESGDPVKATATIRSDPLAARETADFTLEFISPSKSVSQIELAFAEPTD